MVTPNWRQIFLALFLVIIIWYVFFTNSTASTSLSPAVKVNKPEIKKAQIEVYYEVWCPDSRRFILDQVMPTWRKLKNVLDVHWKPYGKASHKKNEHTAVGFDFDCQHGPSECSGNMLHACAVKYVKDQNLLNEYIGCMMQHNVEELEEAGQACAAKVGGEDFKVDWPAISKCSENSQGGTLLANYGDDTHSLKPSVTFIPTVQLNGSQQKQNVLLKDLTRAVCDSFEEPKPDTCLNM